MSVVSVLLWWTCQTFVFVFVSADQKTITAESGQDVTLTCRAPNNNITTVEWGRADMESEFALVYQDGRFVPEYQHPSFKNRVDLQDRQMKDGDVSLILKDVKTHDTGTYECRVFMEETQPWNSIINISLTVFPDQKIITAESGQNVTLICRAPNNNITGVEWSRADLESDHVLLYQDGQFETAKQHPSFKNRVDLQDRQMKNGNVSLNLNNVTAADSGIYKCHFFIEGARSWMLSINLRVVRPDEEIITAEFGQKNITLTCRAPNYNITAVKWSRADLGDKYALLYQDGHFDPDNQHPSFKDRVDLQDRQMKDGDVSLILKDVTTADDGIYECCVLIGETQSCKHNIDLIVIPDEKLITAKSGQDVNLTCRAPNNNTAVKWSRADLESEYVLLYEDGHFISANQHPSFKNRVDLQDRQMKDGDVSLILKDVTINDTEIYECLVFMGGTQSWELSIISLIVIPGQTVGLTGDEGTTGNPSVGLHVILKVFFTCLIFGFISYFIVFFIKTKNKKQNQDSNQPQPEVLLPSEHPADRGKCQTSIM